MKIKKSNKFGEAYIVEGMDGHYYLDNGKEDTLLNVVRVKRMIYSGKWHEETVQFKPDKYKEVMEVLRIII